MTPKWIRLALPALIALTMSFGAASVAFADAHHPIADPDAATVDEDGSVIIDVLANDLPTGEVEIESFTDPANGTVEDNGDGTLTYTPDADFNGPDSFNYTLEGAADEHAMATVTVTVTPDVQPIAEDDEVTTAKNVAVVIDVLDNDTEGDSGVESLTEPSNGAVVLNEDGTLTYTPDVDFNGIDSFEYTLEDDENGDGTATVTVTVQPVAVDDEATTSTNAAVDIDVLANDIPLDSEIESFTQGLNGAVTDNFDGTLKYTPVTDFAGIDWFTYVIKDGDDTSNVATVTVSVGPNADLSIVKEVKPHGPEAATFVLTVSNAGPDDATNVLVIDTLPEGITYVSDDSGGDYDEISRVWTWEIALLADGDSVELRIEVTLDDPEAEVTNTVTVSSDLPDANPDNDQDSLTLNPVATPDFDNCTGAAHPAFAVICELMHDEDSPAVRDVLMIVLEKIAGKTASGWYRNHGGDEDANLAAFCERKPDHKRCPEIEGEGLDVDGDDEGPGKSNGKGNGKNKDNGGDDDEGDDD